MTKRAASQTPPSNDPSGQSEEASNVISRSQFLAAQPTSKPPDRFTLMHHPVNMNGNYLLVLYRH
ncbi:MAG: hypothetical protein ACRD68_15030, partial [Pyrinomonadaceae bacterium]